MTCFEEGFCIVEVKRDVEGEEARWKGAVDSGGRRKRHEVVASLELALANEERERNATVEYSA